MPSLECNGGGIDLPTLKECNMPATIPMKDYETFMRDNPDQTDAVWDAYDKVCDDTANAILVAISKWRGLGMDGFNHEMAWAAHQAVEALPRRAVNGVDAYDMTAQFTTDMRNGEYDRSDETWYGGVMFVSGAFADSLREAVSNFAQMHCGRPKECGEGCPAYTELEIESA